MDETVAYAYNPWNGLVESETRGGGLSVGYAYDALDRVTGLDYRDAASKLVFGISYAYDAVSMITQKVSRTASATNLVAYAYDELDRLVREDDGATAREYDYDLAGNRTAMRVIAGGVTNATAYTLGGGNRLASWTGGGACAYDTAGCVTNLVRSGKPSVALEWDAQYRVTAAYTNGVLAESYGYDALGRRATVTASGVTTHYVNEGPHVVAETDASGNLLRRYEYGPGVDDLLAMTVFSGGVTNTYRYVKDLQNTVWAIRDAAGTIVETYEYDAWGNVLAVRDGSGNLLTESAMGNRYLFQGREYSWATGLYNFRARWYDPITGRWLSNDPIGISGGINQYIFCSDNPAYYIDNYGLIPGVAYDSPDLAARELNDYINNIYGTDAMPFERNSNHVEFSGFVYFDPASRKYMHTEPVPGAVDHVADYWRTDTKRRVSYINIDGTLFRLAGFLHTHKRSPVGPGSIYDDDCIKARSAAEDGVAFYIGNHWGEIVKYIYSSNKWSGIGVWNAVKSIW